MSYHHIYEYKDVNDEVCQFRPDNSSDVIKYKVGDKVPIIYLPGEERGNTATRHKRVAYLNNQGQETPVVSMSMLSHFR